MSRQPTADSRQCGVDVGDGIGVGVGVGTGIGDGVGIRRRSRTVGCRLSTVGYRRLAAGLLLLSALAYADAQREVGSPPPISSTGDGFSFGSYGRIGVGVDGHGHEGYLVNIVSHGSRLEAAPYLELDLYYAGQIKSGPRWRAVLAPALGGDLFHYSGSFASRLALRNAYIETTDLGIRGLRVWAGSRMYRGDDVYQFDYWPLDNLNTVGAGVGFGRGSWDFALQGGLNRLDDLFQYQRQAAPARGLGPTGQALVLDRPRGVMSLKVQHPWVGRSGGGKVVLYGELHLLPAGQQKVMAQDQRTIDLPSDYGWVAGGQLGAWLTGGSFANLFVRYAGGLAAYGDLTAPSVLDPMRRALGARELLLALSANWEQRFVGTMLSGYLRSFSSAAGGATDPASYLEGIVAVRPHLYATRYFHLAAEISYQARQYGGFDPLAGRRLIPQVARASLLPIVAPLGPGSYSRPHVYLIATISWLNDDARLALFEPTDIRYPFGTVLYVGAGAEWWFQSSYR